MTAASDDTTGMIKSVLGYIAGALLMIMGGVVGYQQSQISKLDDRLYVLQATTVTEDKLNSAISRLESSMETKITAVKNVQEVTNTYLMRIVDKLDKK